MGSVTQKRMAQHGFESNDDYDYQLRCLLSGRFEGLRALNIEGDCGRRKTAFASALAQALDYPHILYHDFTQQSPPLPDVILPPSKDEAGREEPPIDPFDQVVSEACAFSEGGGTILILDQIQAADFREHIRIYRFLTEARWEFRDAVYYANRPQLLVFLISEQPLYHSLQKHSFRIWVNRVSPRQVPYRPEDFGLGEDALGFMNRLGEVFETLGMAPTRSEYAHLIQDIHRGVRTTDALRHSIYGWTEGVNRDLLYSGELEDPLEAAVRSVLEYIGLEEVELASQSADAPG
jgi:hypothetical protein